MSIAFSPIVSPAHPLQCCIQLRYNFDLIVSNAISDIVMSRDFVPIRLLL